MSRKPAKKIAAQKVATNVKPWVGWTIATEGGDIALIYNAPLIFAARRTAGHSALVGERVVKVRVEVIP